MNTNSLQNNFLFPPPFPLSNNCSSTENSHNFIILSIMVTIRLPTSYSRFCKTTTPQQPYLFLKLIFLRADWENKLINSAIDRFELEPTALISTVLSLYATRAQVPSSITLHMRLKVASGNYNLTES